TRSRHVTISQCLSGTRPRKCIRVHLARAGKKGQPPMPIIALQPWSQFTRTDDAPIDAAGLLVFRGGVTVPLILRMSDANGTQELEQAVEVDGQAFPCGAVLTASSDALAPDARQGHVLTLNDTPIGICLEPEQRLR
ncbi:unnamed protein product, partial [Ectocarpus sp. 12 AP-2014]